MGLKLGCFAGFCHHRLTAMSAHTHAHRYPLVESGTKIGLRAIALRRKDRVLLRNTNNNSKVDFSYNNNLCTCTVCYGNLIIGIL